MHRKLPKNYVLRAYVDKELTIISTNWFGKFHMCNYLILKLIYWCCKVLLYIIIFLHIDYFFFTLYIYKKKKKFVIIIIIAELLFESISVHL